MNRHFAPRILYVLLILSFALVAVPPAAAAPVVAPQVSTTMVISQFQVAGGSAADEFIELHNVSTGNVDLNGYRVVYRAAAGTTDVGLVSWTASTIVAPGGYYLIAHTSYDGTPAADITFNLGSTGSLSGTSGGLAIRNGALNTGTIVDSVGYGSATNAFVETATTTVPAANASKARKNNGCQDTDNNSNDFELISPSVPRNSSTTAVSCGGGDAAPSVLSTSPANGATNVAGNAPVNVTFSEPVTFVGPISVVCTNSGTQTVTTPSGSGAAWSLPHTDFSSGDSCSITIPAAQVSDLDGIDPLNMAAPYTWSFTVDAAPYVSSTTPANGATGVAVGADLSVTFSEPVDVNTIDSFFDIYCDSVLQPAAGSGGPTTFTINPTADLPAGSSCTVTIKAAQVTDQDANDPPDNMAANHVFTFTTAAADAAPTVSATVPLDGATGVAAGADLSVTFSEPVSVSNIDSFFDIYCDSVPQPAAGSGGPTTFTINPTADLPAGSSCTVTIHAADVTDQDANDPPNNMAADYNWDFTVAEPVTLIINELDSDTPGTDVAEFIELYDGGVGNTSLTGMAIVLFNGNGDVSYGAFDLDGRSTNAAGYFVICGNAANVANCNWDVTPDSDLIQNGADAAALYLANATDFPNGTAVSTTNLVDAIVYDTADADDAGLLVLLNAGQPQVDESSNGNSANESNQRCPNGTGGQRNTTTYLQHTPTSGAANYCPEYAPPVVSSTTPANGATGVAVGTTITINFNKLVDVEAGAFTVECPAGTAVSFTANPALPAGDITSVVLTPSSALPASTTCTVTALASKITDNNSPAQQLDGNGDGAGGDNYVFTFTTAAVDPCTQPATLISYIQGSGAASPYAGSSFTIQGIVVGDYEEDGIKGYFVQEEDADADADPLTSEGIFVYDNNATSEVSLGDKVRLTGTVSEYYTLTEVTIGTAATICSGGNSVTPASVSLPVAALADLERYEGMKVTFPQTLTVTDNYDLGYYGQLTLSANGKLWQFTHLNAPSVSGYAAYLAGLPLRTIVLDDGGTATNPDPIVYPGTGLTALNTVRVGDTVTGLTGVLDYRYDLFRVQKIGQVDFTPSNPRPAIPPTVDGSINVGAFNTPNIFGDPLSLLAEQQTDMQTQQMLNIANTGEQDLTRDLHGEEAAAPVSAAQSLIAAGPFAPGMTPVAPVTRSPDALINDGSFENGPPPTSAWTEVSDSACEWIGDWSGVWGVAAYDGTYDFWAGGYCGGVPTTSSVEQTIAVPATNAILPFRYLAYRPDTDDADADYAYIQVNGTTVWTLPLVQANDTYPNWVNATVDLSAYAGQSVALKLDAVSAGAQTGNVRFDYLEFVAPPIPPVKVGAFNTLNFFVTTGAGYTCGPYSDMQCRGASNAAEYTRQLDKLVAAICGLNADVLGLMELENPDLTETTDPVLGALVTALNASPACVDDYAFIDNAWAGTDAIRQGLIYKPTVVAPVGVTANLVSTAFINGGDSSARNRPALTQAFEALNGGERFIVSVNHLKSKGSACTAPDLNDGQGNCAVVRTNAAIALTAWLATNPTGTGDPDILIMGDLNSYAKEDPITALVNAGYTDLINWTVGSAGYSYAFDGMMGYLDHALGSPSLLAQTLAANEWHINSDEPDVLDYNTEYKSTGQVTSLYNADPYRSTDHDPVLVGLGLYPDQGDLAPSYGLAWHTGQGVLRLGSLWTGEASSTPGGDNPSDDGVTFSATANWGGGGGGGAAGAIVTAASSAGCLNGWMDFTNGLGVGSAYADGDFGDSYLGVSEHLIVNIPVPAGAYEISFPVPPGLLGATSASYAFRFRLSPAPCTTNIQPTGRVDGGEVEDYQFTFSPLAVTLANFTAEVAAEGVTLAWETVSETDNAGFNVYRADSEDGPWTKLNEALIASAAPGSSEGHSYAWTDGTAAQGATYWYALEDVALDGTATQHEPITVTVAQPNAVGLAAFGAAPIAASTPALAGLAAALAAAVLTGMGLRRRRR